MRVNAAQKAKLYDLAAAIPMMAWLVLGIGGSLLRITQMLDAHGDVLAICSQLANVAFLSLLTLLVIIRCPAVRKARGLLPRGAGIVGVLLPSVFLALPRAKLTPAMAIFSSATALLGIISAIFIACWLGRSFGILPQARSLVTEGPYSVVRHPLYLAELIVVFGGMWQFDYPWSFCAMFLTITAQIPRMHYEERVLMEAFPSYRDYADRTARLLPGIY
ncbi:MAG: methyltransferase family protein [Methylocystis sp.]|uniref:methyltransferase family protein n=2 Tax=Methylocystis sp. TaxID=1911079 RepID=UPI003DA2C6A0